MLARTVAAVRLITLSCFGIRAAGPALADGCQPYVEATNVPAGFDPLTASSAQLSCYGFPVRPTDPTGLSLWESLMKQAKHYVYPQDVVDEASSLPQTETVVTTYQQPTWAGYGVFPSDNPEWPGLEWNGTGAEWNVTTAHTYCTNNSVSAWTGIGATDNIDQAGTYSINASPPEYFFFWEDFPGNPHVVDAVPIGPGDPVDVGVTYNRSQANTTYFFMDVATQSVTSFTEATPNPPASGDPATYILEYHSSGGSNNYIKFGTEAFSSAEMNGTWGSGSYIGSTLYHFRSVGYQMQFDGQNKTWETTPGDSGSFNMYSENAGC